MLVEGTRLAFHTMLGIVGAHLPRLDRCEVIGPDDLDSYASCLLVHTDVSLPVPRGILPRLLRCPSVRTCASLQMNVWVYPSNDLRLTGPTLSQLSSSPGLYNLVSSSSWLSISSLVDGLWSLAKRNLLYFLRDLHCAIHSSRFLARIQVVRHGLAWNTRRISFGVMCVFFHRGYSSVTALILAKSNDECGFHRSLKYCCCRSLLNLVSGSRRLIGSKLRN